MEQKVVDRTNSLFRQKLLTCHTDLKLYEDI